MSARWSTLSPLACSGAMYGSEPITTPAMVTPVGPPGSTMGAAGGGSSSNGCSPLAAAAAREDREIPKSMICAW